MWMWSYATYDLRLPGDEFFALTPRQFDALVRRHTRRVSHDELLFAQLTSWVVNTGFRSTEKPTHPRDFMPSEWKTKATPAKSPPKRMTSKRRAAVADLIRLSFGIRTEKHG